MNDATSPKWLMGAHGCAANAFVLAKRFHVTQSQVHNRINKFIRERNLNPSAVKFRNGPDTFFYENVANQIFHWGEKVPTAKEAPCIFTAHEVTNPAGQKLVSINIIATKSFAKRLFNLIESSDKEAK